MKRHAKIGMSPLQSHSSGPCLTHNQSKPSGDRIIVVVQKARTAGENSPGGATSIAAANKVRRGDIRHAVVVRTKKKLQRKDGMVVRFDDNACALIGKNGEPLGTRINGEFICLFASGNALGRYDTPGESSGYTNLLPYRCCWLGAEGEAVVQDLVFGGDKCINRNLNVFLCILYKSTNPSPSI